MAVASAGEVLLGLHGLTTTQNADQHAAVTITNSVLDVENLDVGRIGITGGQVAIVDSTFIADEIEVTSKGKVPLDTTNQNPVQPASVAIINSLLDVDGFGGGRIGITGNRVVVEDSLLSARTSGTESGRGITLQAQTQIDLVRSLIDTRTSYEGNAGDIRLEAPYILLDTRDASGQTSTIYSDTFDATSEIGLRSDSMATTEPALHWKTDLAIGLGINYPYWWGLGVTLISPVGTDCLLYTSPSPRDQRGSRMPSSA